MMVQPTVPAFDTGVPPVPLAGAVELPGDPSAPQPFVDTLRAVLEQVEAALAEVPAAAPEGTEVKLEETPEGWIADVSGSTELPWGLGTYYRGTGPAVENASGSSRSSPAFDLPGSAALSAVLATQAAAHADRRAHATRGGPAGSFPAEGVARLLHEMPIAAPEGLVAPRAGSAKVSADFANAPAMVQTNFAVARPSPLVDAATGAPAPVSAELGVPAAAAGAAHARDAAVLQLPPGEPSLWRQPLVHALGERLKVEVGPAGERAVIRLDPPSLGRVDIVIRLEGGALQVQLSASHSDVARQLQAIGEILRQDLAQRQYTDVSVLVSDSSRDGGERQRQHQAHDENASPGHALVEAEEDAGSALFDGSELT